MIFIFNDVTKQWELKYAGFCTTSVKLSSTYLKFKGATEESKLRVLIIPDDSNVIFGACRRPAPQFPILKQNGEWLMRTDDPTIPEILYLDY